MSDIGVLIQSYVSLQYPWAVQAAAGTFAIVNGIRIVAYVPQIVRAARDTNGAAALSFSTWGMFLVSHLTTAAYAVVVAGDFTMMLVFLGNSLACAAILAVTWSKRRAYRRQSKLPTAGPRSSNGPSARTDEDRSHMHRAPLWT